MYAKALMPSDSPSRPAAPLLIMTVAPGAVITRQLIQRGGWHPFRVSMELAQGEVRITPDSLLVVVDGQVILQDDTNPISPDGWWEAVDGMQGHVALLLVPSGTPFDQPALAAALDALEGSDSTAQAILSVVHAP